MLTHRLSLWYFVHNNYPILIQAQFLGFLAAVLGSGRLYTITYQDSRLARLHPVLTKFRGSSKQYHTSQVANSVRDVSKDCKQRQVLEGLKTRLATLALPNFHSSPVASTKFQSPSACRASTTPFFFLPDASSTSSCFLLQVYQSSESVSCSPNPDPSRLF